MDDSTVFPLGLWIISLHFSITVTHSQNVWTDSVGGVLYYYFYFQACFIFRNMSQYVTSVTGAITLISERLARDLAEGILLV